QRMECAEYDKSVPGRSVRSENSDLRDQRRYAAHANQRGVLFSVDRPTQQFRLFRHSLRRSGIQLHSREGRRSIYVALSPEEPRAGTEQGVWRADADDNYVRSWLDHGESRVAHQYFQRRSKTLLR